LEERVYELEEEAEMSLEARMELSSEVNDLENDCYALEQQVMDPYEVHAILNKIEERLPFHSKKAIDIRWLLDGII